MIVFFSEKKIMLDYVHKTVYTKKNKRKHE